MNRFEVLCSFVVFSALAGCGASKTYVSHSDLSTRVHTSTRVGIVIGGTSCYQVDAAGETAILKEKTDLMKTCVEQGALRAFSDKGYEANILTSSDDDIRKILRAYRRIHHNARNQFPDGEEPVSNPVDFGDLAPLMERKGIDVLAVIHAAARSSTAGQKTAKAGLALLSYALGAGAYDFDYGYADIALIGPGGRLLYYESLPSPTYELLNKENTENIFRLLVDHINTAAKSS